MSATKTKARPNTKTRANSKSKAKSRQSRRTDTALEAMTAAVCGIINAAVEGDLSKRISLEDKPSYIVNL